MSDGQENIGNTMKQDEDDNSIEESGSEEKLTANVPVEVVPSSNLESIPISPSIWDENLFAQILTRAVLKEPRSVIRAIERIEKIQLNNKRLRDIQWADDKKDERKFLLIVLAMMLLLFMSVLYYSAQTNNTELPKEVLFWATTVMGGGSAGAVLTLRNQSKDK